MSDLVDTSMRYSGRHNWQRIAALTLALTCFVVLVAWAAFKLSRSTPGPAHQVAKIALLPDLPPPPPPPPPPDKPRVEPKAQMQQSPVQKQTPPEPQQLKMDGQAGEGPSPFASGDVKNDYIGGDVGNGARFAAYVSRIAQLVQETLARRNLHAANARVLLWLKPDGSIQRYEVRGASGDLERQLRTAMADLGRVPEAPPGDMPMPLGLEISDR
jgi:protein TonB